MCHALSFKEYCPLWPGPWVKCIFYLVISRLPGFKVHQPVGLCLPGSLLSMSSKPHHSLCPRCLKPCTLRGWDKGQAWRQPGHYLALHRSKGCASLCPMCCWFMGNQQETSFSLALTLKTRETQTKTEVNPSFSIFYSWLAMWVSFRCWIWWAQAHLWLCSLWVLVDVGCNPLCYRSKSLLLSIFIK